MGIMVGLDMYIVANEQVDYSYLRVTTQFPLVI